ncbi:hypothetical protein HYT23_02890 [Candidatus Pacearchaeota archaeon]|nr:hypothetical protein [Candidatus Pacearchaeota archaeon]
MGEIHYCFDKEDLEYIYYLDDGKYTAIALHISLPFFDESLMNAVRSFTYSPVVHNQGLLKKLNLE